MAERYRDPTLTVEDRVADLLEQMTLEEKVAQLGGVWITDLVSPDGFDEGRAAQRLGLGIGHVTRIGASTGLRPVGERGAHERRAALRRRADTSRHPGRRPRGIDRRVLRRDATVFPQAIGLAATWDPALVEEVASVIREQLLAVGRPSHAGPRARHRPRSSMGSRRGDVRRESGARRRARHRLRARPSDRRSAQRRDLHRQALPRLRLARGRHEPRARAPRPRELREMFAEPFAAAIRDAGLASIMNSYSSIDGLPCAGRASILTELLRDELGFDGVVVADYNAVDLLITHHHTAADKAAAAAQALSAGLDLELPAFDCYRQLTQLVENGMVDVALVDRAAGRVLASKFRLGLFEQPYVDADRAAAVFDTFSQRDLARRAAARSIVLLRNEVELLPLDLEKIGRVAVIGPLADSIRGLQGDYHYPAHTEIVYEMESSASSLLPQAGGAFAPARITRPTSPRSPRWSPPSATGPRSTMRLAAP